MIDPFSPWQEDPKELARRTVGRDDVVDALTDTIDAFLAGKERSWSLVAGPRGMGKSHVLQVVRSRISRPDAVTWVGEDTPLFHKADRLWAFIWHPQDPWGWTPQQVSSGPRVLFVEGFDRLIAGLAKGEAWTFRHLLQESGAFLVATSLSSSIVAGETNPFFGQFSPWVLEALSQEQALQLYRTLSEEPEDAPAPMLTRRIALTRLAGGSPRAIVTLATAACGVSASKLGTAEALLGAVQRLVTHYQQRFQDLPPLAQQIVQNLAMAPRELTASEVARLTQHSSAAVSGAAKVLEATGALERRRDAKDARASRYRLAEPLFRYWLEYRTLPAWENTRISWLGRLLGEVLSREELLNVWWSSEDPDIRRAVGENTPEFERYSRLLQGVRNGKAVQMIERFRTAQLGRFMVGFAVEILRAVPHHLPRLRIAFPDHEVLQALLDFQSAEDEPRPRFILLLTRLAKASDPPWASIDHFVSTVMAGWNRRGRPWKRFSGADAQLLARLPALRLRFAVQGKRPTHPPLLDWRLIEAAPLSAATPDLQALISTAHQLEEEAMLGRALAVARWLPLCPRPERPSAAAAAQLARMAPYAWTHTWAASWVYLSDSAFQKLLTGLADVTWCGACQAETSTALIALALRAPDRFAQLQKALPDQVAIDRAARLLRQLEERANGPLQPELELVWQAVAPPDRR